MVSRGPAHVRPMYGSSTSRAPFLTEYLSSAAYRASVVIRSTSARIRQFILSLLALAAIVHANLTTDLTGRAPTSSGITQLGRDILRKGRVAEQSPALDGIHDRMGDHLLPQRIVVLDLPQHIARKNV